MVLWCIARTENGRDGVNLKSTVVKMQLSGRLNTTIEIVYRQKIANETATESSDNRNSNSYCL